MKKAVNRGQISERIRMILDWPHQSNRTHPYEGVRQRKLSGSSTCSSEYSQLSPASDSSSSLPYSPSVSHPAIRSSRDLLVFEKLRHLVPQLNSEQNPLQALMDIVTHAMDVEANPDSSSAFLGSLAPSLSGLCNLSEAFPVPEDLQNVDVSAFKHLIYSQPIFFDSRLFL